MLPEEAEPEEVETQPAGLEPARFEQARFEPGERENPPLETVIVPEPPPSPKRDPFWGYLDLLLVFGLLFAFTVVALVGVGLLAIPFPKIRSDPMSIALPFQIVFYELVYLSFRLVFGIRYHEPVARSLGWRRPNINLLLAAFGGFILALILSALGSVLKTPKISSPFDELTKTGFSFGLFAVVAIVLAPLLEEFFFRGFIQPLLSRTFGTITGVVLTAGLFGALHGPEYSWVWQYALFITLAGVVFGILRARTNSIVPSVVMHGCFNAVSIVALAFGKNI